MPNLIPIEKDSSDTPSVTGTPRYPYGTSLNFEDDMIEKIGLSSAVVGDVVEVRALAVVESMSEHKSVDEEGSSNVKIQLTSIKIQPVQGDVAEQLYPESK